MGWSGNGYPFTAARAVAVACGLLLGARTARAVTISSVTVAARDARTATVKFDICWADSWRHEVNHDAVWVFFKARADDKSEWQHVRLSADKVLNPKGYGHAEGTRLEFLVPDGAEGFTGVFLRRADYSLMDTVKTRAATVVWDVAAAKGIVDVGKSQVRAFGTEMVYVAEGPFYLGSGGSEANAFYRYTDGTQCTAPYRVTGPGAIATGRQNGRLWARSSERLTGLPSQPEDGGEIPAAFPNGYAAFYCMRYYLTRAEYAALMDTLTGEQAKARYNIHVVDPPPRYISRGISWADGATYAAWAGLRPMTELELEKIIRGPCEPLPDEVRRSYWNVGDFADWDWPAYHGGLTDRLVTVGHAAGRKFAGTHGRGTPKLPADWPQEDAVGAGIHGGSGGVGGGRLGVGMPAGSEQISRHRVSDRLHATVVDPGRDPWHRWRGVRTAPREAAAK
jgi:hypothetical protein